MKVILSLFILFSSHLNIATAQQRNPKVDLPPASEMPKVLRCGVFGNRISDGRGSVLLAQGITKLVYNKARPKIDTTPVKSPWSGEVEYRHFISWKLNSRLTKPLTMKFDTSKIDITAPKNGPVKRVKAQIQVKPSMISYFIPHKTSFEESAQFGFDLKADSKGNALKMSYYVANKGDDKPKAYTAYGKKSAMRLYEAAHDYNYFSMFRVVDGRDRFHRIFRDESSNPDSYVKNLRFVTSKPRAYLGKFSIVCTLRSKL